MFRSLIFVPGNSTRFVEKAKTLRADVICFDLEDSVPTNEKDVARKIISDAISQRQEYSGSVYVRTNSPDSGMVAADLKAVIHKGIDGIVVPKVNDSKEMTMIRKQIIGLEKQRKTGKIALMPSIETAKGIVNAYHIANSDERVNALVFGVFDFLHDMGMDYDESDPTGYAYARAKIPIDARAAGVEAIDAIWQKIDDLQGLVRDAMSAKRLGYRGKSIVHPNQINPVHKVFVPNNDEVEWARKVVGALGEAMEKGTGRGTIRLEGRMIDAVHYKQAKAILNEVDNSNFQDPT